MFLVMAALRIAPVVAVAAAAAGCFDVSADGPTPLLIDNFDGGDLLPTDHHFDQWRCGRFKPDTTENCACGYDDTTYHSYPYSIYLDASIDDWLDGTPDYGGAQVYTQATVPEDLSHMSRIGFSAKLEPPPPAVSTGATLYVEFYCTLAHTTKVAIPDDELHVLHAVDFANVDGWQSFSIGLSEDQFAVPNNYEGSKIVGGLTACLERVDGIHFSVNAQLKDGKSGKLVLHLDDIYLE
jgi:hypothetical protein